MKKGLKQKCWSHSVQHMRRPRTAQFEACVPSEKRGSAGEMEETRCSSISAGAPSITSLAAVDDEVDYCRS